MPLAIPDGFVDGASYAPSPTPNDSGGVNMGNAQGNQTVIDGTPARVAAIGLASAAVIVALRWAGLRFNVAVSS